MQARQRFGWFSHVGQDVPAGLVVFLVALPLCLGIAQASGAPPLAGLVAGVIGGLVVPLISQSPLSVSGPAAGLAVIVAAGIADLGLATFALAVLLAGALQFAFGLLRLGMIAHFFPNAVIKGMLAAIGILIVLKQIPHAVGFDRDYEGDEAFDQVDGSNTFTTLADALDALSPGALVVTGLGVAVYLLWPRVQRGALRQIPAALIAVVVGGLWVLAAPHIAPALAIASEHLVRLPTLDSWVAIRAGMTPPDASQLMSPAVWKMAGTLAIVASIETLLCLEAVDRIDPHRRISPPNRELLAQGVGNVLAGLLGALPITSVIVRSSANVQAGGQTRLSAAVHGAAMLVGVVIGAPLLNTVPLAALAVVLIFVGVKLSPVALWRSMWAAGWTQFVPFAATVVAVVVTDLLTGTLVGLIIGTALAIRTQQARVLTVAQTGNTVLIRLNMDLTFLNKAALKDALSAIDDGREVIIDRRVIDYVDADIEEVLEEFTATASDRGIAVHIDYSPQELERRVLRADGAAAAA